MDGASSEAEQETIKKRSEEVCFLVNSQDRCCTVPELLTGCESKEESAKKPCPDQEV